MNKLSLKYNILYALSTIFYYAGYCIIIGYISVYLLSQGLTNTKIGMILAFSQVLSVIIQPLLINIIEKYHHSKVRIPLLQLVGCVLILSFILFCFHKNQIILSLCVISILALVMAMMSLVNSLAFEYQEIHINYGISRGLGSLAYALTSLLLGFLLKMYAASLLPLLYLVDFIFLALVLMKYSYHEEIQFQKKEVQKKSSTIVFLKKYPFFTCFLVGVIFIFFNHTFINHFLIQIIRSLKGSSLEMSKAIFIASLVELPMMFLYNKINQKISTNILIKLAMFMFFIKHLITFLASTISMIYLGQCFQIVAYALFIPASVYYVRENILKQDQLKGQALVTMSMTLAGIFSDLCGGFLIDLMSIKKVLLLATLFSFIGLFISFYSFHIKRT